MGLQIRVPGGLLIIVLAGVSPGAGAEIYRCESDGVVEFSDTPCQSEPQTYRSAGNVSVVGAPDDLEQTTRLNQAFIEQRLERREQQRRERQRQAEETAALERHQSAAAPASSPYLPLRYRAFPRHKNHPIQSRPPRRGSYPSEPPPERQPFSALSGPFPGTRRRDRAER